MHEDTAHPLTAEEFARAKNRVIEVLAQIRCKYPTLKPKAVICAASAQCDLDAGPETILKACPALLLDNPAKHELRNLPDLPKDPPPEARTAREKQVTELSAKLLYSADCLVELRFGHLDYPRIWELQNDALVDRERTPVSRASIRVVVATLSDLLRHTKLTLS